MTNNQRTHKAGCMANMVCAVYHPDGVCPGPYGKCTCDEIPNQPEPKLDIGHRPETTKECGCDNKTICIKCGKPQQPKWKAPYIPDEPEAELEEKINNYWLGNDFEGGWSIAKEELKELIHHLLKDQRQTIVEELREKWMSERAKEGMNYEEAVDWMEDYLSSKI